MPKKTFKRVVAIGDLHCGHRVGLTPPAWQYSAKGNKYFKIQRELWNEYAGIMDRLKPIDILIVNGDVIDGRGERSGGTELIETDRLKQVDMAAEAINYCKADKVVITRGTPYHTGFKEDFEDGLLQKATNCTKIGDHEFYNVNGVVFDVKHSVSSSSIPYGQFTPVAKDRLWNLIWSEYDMQPKADILLRSHVHYFLQSGGVDWDAFVLPALQGMGSKFGAKICSGLVHFGVCWFDVFDKPDKWGKKWEFNKHIVKLKSQAATVTEL